MKNCTMVCFLRKRNGWLTKSIGFWGGRLEFALASSLNATANIFITSRCGSLRSQLGRIKSEYRQKGIGLARAIHPRFVIPHVGVVWKMLEDLSAPYPGFGLGSLDAFHGFVVYRLLAPDQLWQEIAQMRELVENSYRQLHVTQDLGLGMLLWMSHFFPDEAWAVALRQRS